MKDLIVTIAVLLGCTIVAIALLVLGAWLDASATCTEVIIKSEKYITCEQGSKGFYKCKTEYL